MLVLGVPVQRGHLVVVPLGDLDGEAGAQVDDAEVVGEGPPDGDDVGAVGVGPPGNGYSVVKEFVEFLCEGVGIPD